MSLDRPPGRLVFELESMCPLPEHLQGLDGVAIATALTEGVVVAFGGRCPSKGFTSPKVWRAHVTSGGALMWEEVQMDTAMPCRSHHTATFTTGGVVVLIGGLGQNSAAVADTIYFDASAVVGKTSRWHVSCDHHSSSWVPPPRHSHAAVYLPLQHAIVVAGGVGPRGQSLADVAWFDVSSGAWSQVLAPLPRCLSGHSLISSGADVYLFGGDAPTSESSGNAGLDVFHITVDRLLQRRQISVKLRRPRVLSVGPKKPRVVRSRIAMTEWTRLTAQGDLPASRRYAAVAMIAPHIVLLHGGRLVQPQHSTRVARLLRWRDPSDSAASRCSAIADDCFLFDRRTLVWSRLLPLAPAVTLRAERHALIQAVNGRVVLLAQEGSYVLRSDEFLYEEKEREVPQRPMPKQSAPFSVWLQRHPLCVASEPWGAPPGTDDLHDEEPLRIDDLPQRRHQEKDESVVWEVEGAVPGPRLLKTSPCLAPRPLDPPRRARSALGMASAHSCMPLTHDYQEQSRSAESAALGQESDGSKAALLLRWLRSRRQRGPSVGSDDRTAPTAAVLAAGRRSLRVASPMQW